MHTAPQDQFRRLLREALHRLDFEPPRRLAAGPIGLFQHRRESLAAILPDMDETPGRELAMVGRARRDLEHPAQLVGIRTWLDEVARPSRTASGEVGEQGGSVVQHGLALPAGRRACNNPASQGGIAR